MRSPLKPSGSLPSAAFFAFLFLILAWGCVPPAPVVQGPVTAVEQEGGVIRVQDEVRPEVPPIPLDIRSAEIGSAPVVGDQVRVVYRAEGEVNRALRVMNLTRQKEVEQSGH
ncbi:MAG: hypothetical protein ACOYXN_06425 [Acidobacteriota bacterium]